jgi:hypothetical protein
MIENRNANKRLVGEIQEKRSLRKLGHKRKKLLNIDLK